MKKITQPFIALALLFLLQACFTTARFDQYAYTQTTALKVDALNLMDKATSTFTSNEPVINAFNEKLDKAYEYELHRKNNAFSIKMWDKLRDPDKNLLGGFMKRWKNDGQLGNAFVTEAKMQVGKAFNEIAELESGKIKATDIAN
jgi:hypothetical protein